jgi:hypothetical protein
MYASVIFCAMGSTVVDPSILMDPAQTALTVKHAKAIKTLNTNFDFITSLLLLFWFVKDRSFSFNR